MVREMNKEENFGINERIMINANSSEFLKENFFDVNEKFDEIETELKKCFTFRNFKKLEILFAKMKIF